MINRLAFLKGYLSKYAKVSLDIEVGDIVLTGRYKNKRMEVKELGTDELGQPTVNGQKLLAVRIEKKLPKSKWSKKSLDKEAKSLEECEIDEDELAPGKMLEYIMAKLANDAEGSPSYSLSTSGSSTGSNSTISSNKNSNSFPMSKVPKTGTPQKSSQQDVTDVSVAGTTSALADPSHKSHSLKMLKTSLATQQNTFPQGHPLESLNVLARNNANAVNSMTEKYPAGGMDPAQSAYKAMEDPAAMQETLNRAMTPGLASEMGKVQNGDYIVELLNESRSMQPQDAERYLETKLGEADRFIDNKI